MKDFEPKVTAKGTQLPLLNLKGKPYMQVAWRLVWFKEEQPAWTIETALVEFKDTYAIAKAQVYNAEGRCIATGHKKETEENFPDFIEKAETGAVGRALAMAGFGTQFEPDLDEGNRLADAPITVAKEISNEPKTETKRSGAKSISKETKNPVYANIQNTASVLFALNKTTREAFATDLKTRYGVSKSAELTEDQASEFLGVLKQLLPNAAQPNA